MFAALLTTFFFALSAILARRSIGYLGSQPANLARQIVALILLGTWAHVFGEGLKGPTLGILLISGAIGFGIGDWALFEALPRIGSGLTILLCQCLAAPIAAITEWLWLGTGMTGAQMLASAAILGGVALALAPESKTDIPAGHRVAGVAFGIVASAGQAWGAVLSRYAFRRAHESGFFLDGITSAYQRLWGGAICVVFLLILRRATSRWHGYGANDVAPPDWGGAWPWVLANALTGATLGVSCYQWALKSTPSAIVLPIVATAPLVVMFLSFVMEGMPPTRRAMAGSVLAVGGVVAMVVRG